MARVITVVKNDCRYNDMKKYSYEEFIRYDRNFCRDKLDFYGDSSPLDECGQKEFLKEYCLSYKKRYGNDVMFRKAVNDEQTKAAAKIADCRTDNLDFYAYTRKRGSEYSGWNFYSDRAFVRGGSIVLDDSFVFPVPCAEYEFGDAGVKRIEFDILIGEKYEAYLPEGMPCPFTGRVIEFRRGLDEIIKLSFTQGGVLYYKDGRNKKYHYEPYKVGDYSFGKKSNIRIDFSDGCFEIVFDGEKHTFECARGLPDVLFLSGGMQPADGWEITPISATDRNGKPIDMLSPCEKISGPDVFIGKTALPCVIGTEKHKDEILVLKSKFSTEKGYAYALDIDALDPGGEVFVNGRSVVRKDTFEPFSVDITDFIKPGDNELEINVFPRAPETLFAWHRHRDYYNGWFCLGARLKKSGIFFDGKTEVITRSVGKNTDFTVRLASAELCKINDAEYSVYIMPSFPQKGEKALLTKNKLHGDICENFSLPVEAWRLDEPRLYEVSVVASRGGEELFRSCVETGFRTIEQKNGDIYLNGEKILLKGALNMQFLPPYEEIPVNHVCPSAEQIIEEVLAVKNMNGNCMRLHQLGYGCGDARFAKICDRLGLLLIWTTRLIDSAENVLWSGEWMQKDAYVRQINHVKEHPSIIMWEGSNEFHADLNAQDKLYDEFVSTVTAADPTRLVSPVSHPYYGGGLYNIRGCDYYSTDGTKNSNGMKVRSSFGWTDKSVVRSAHTYSLLLGYGTPWRNMVEQNWTFQDELFCEKQKAYIISEFAVIGRQNPETQEALKFMNRDSYELVDELVSLGYKFDDVREWELSQAFQALCASVTVKRLLRCGADGMLWCCLRGGANDASYQKSVVDFYGYKKLAYYALKECFGKAVAFNSEPDVLYCENYAVKPCVSGIDEDKSYSLEIAVSDKDGNAVDSVRFDDARNATEWIPQIDENGYYVVRYILTEN